MAGEDSTVLVLPLAGVNCVVFLDETFNSFLHASLHTG